MQSLSERTAGFTDSVIRRMTRVSMQYDAVNLSQGFPDFEPPKELLDRLAQVAYEDYHQYSITWGSQNFREALAAKQTYFMGRRIDPNTEIVTTCGSTEAMMAAMMTVTNPGDKVIIFSPFYENYGADTILSGAERFMCRSCRRISTLMRTCSRMHSVSIRRPSSCATRPIRVARCSPARSWRLSRLSRRSTIPTLSPRGIRAHRIRAEQAHLFCHPAGHVGAHAVVLVALQDVLGYRLAAGLHHRAAGDYRPCEKST